MQSNKLITIAIAAVAAFGLSISQAQAWSGCGFGVNASWVAGGVDIPGTPINIGAEAPMAGASANCDMKLGAMIVGAFVSGNFATRDFKTIGINHDLTVGGRAGILVSQSTLAYALAGWSRMDTDGGHADGLKLGGGVEFALPQAAGWYMALEYAHAWYDNALSSGLNAHSDSASLRLSYKFGATKQLPIFADSEPAPAAKPACDKKLANCK